MRKDAWTAVPIIEERTEQRGRRPIILHVPLRGSKFRELFILILGVPQDVYSARLSMLEAVELGAAKVIGPACVAGVRSR